jgi:hypothetical protein
LPLEEYDVARLFLISPSKGIFLMQEMRDFWAENVLKKTDALKGPVFFYLLLLLIFMPL